MYCSPLRLLALEQYDRLNQVGSFPLFPNFFSDAPPLCRPSSDIPHLPSVSLPPQAGVRCSLITGEDMREVPGATHFSCTVEMADIKKWYDVAVIDEIQVGSGL